MSEAPVDRFTVVMLDFDGVLTTPRSHMAWRSRLAADPQNLGRSRLRTEDRSMLSGGPPWDADCLAAFTALTDRIGECAIVVTSTWRVVGRGKLEKWLFDAGVRVPVMDVTPDLWVPGGDAGWRRSLEITRWLADHPVSGRVLIVDDDRAADDGLGRFLRTDPDTGLTMADVERAVALVGGIG